MIIDLKDIKIHSKPQVILKQLILGYYNFNGLKHRNLKSVNNSTYTPIEIS